MKSFVNILLVLLLSLISAYVFAGALPSNWSSVIDNNSEIRLTHKSGDAVDQVKSYIFSTILPIAKSVIMIIALLYLTVIISQVITAIGEEKAISGLKEKTGYMILGFIIIAIAEPVSRIFDPTIGDNYIQFGNKRELAQLVNTVINTLTIIVGGIAILLMTISGVRLIFSKGEDGIVKEQKKGFTYSFIGIIIILLFKRVVTDILYVNYGMTGPNERAIVGLSQEILGVIAFAFQYLIFAAVGLIILAGTYYIFSFGSKDGGKLSLTVIKNVAIGLLVIITSYTIVSTMIPH